MTTVNIHTQVADVLAAARGLIEERGWRGPSAPPSALVVSANLALHLAGVRSGPKLYVAALRAMREVTGTLSLAIWGTAPGRTKEEVLAAFETAEANERRRAEA